MPDHGHTSPSQQLWSSMMGEVLTDKTFARKALSGVLGEEIVYWRARRLYWEGVAHPAGGDEQEEAAIHTACGAETAVRQLADRLGIAPEHLPAEERAHKEAVGQLVKSLDHEEHTARQTLDRLGPSARIPMLGRMKDYVAADDAEMVLEQAQAVRSYLHWLDETDDEGKVRS